MQQHIRITPRDWRGLRLVADMRAMRLDHLGQWFAPELEPAQHGERTGPVYPPGEKRRRLPWPLDPGRRIQNSYEIVRRWQSVGLARLEKPFADAPMWCWITGSGLTQLGLPYQAAFPALVHLEHLHQTNHVRIQLARASQAGNIPPHTWISERAPAAEQEERRSGMAAGHRPDGVLHLLDGGLEAVEVELTRKSYERLAAILEELTGPLSGYTRVRYFVSDTAAPALMETCSRLEQQQRERIDLYRL